MLKGVYRMIKSEISQWVFNEKYRFENESEAEFADRIGKALGKTSEEVLLFSNLIQNHKFMPAGRSLYGLGTGKKSICYSNCFVIPIRKDSMDAIMEAATNAAMTFKWGGGVGYNFSILRPNKAKTFKSDGKSTGVVSFMHIFNSICETIMTGGNRRGAGVAVLNCFSDNTLILTNIGWLNILDLIEKIENGESIKACDENGEYHNIKNPIINEPEQIYEIECEDGSIIEVTNVHEFEVRNIQSGDVYLKKIKDIDFALEELKIIEEI